MKKDDEFVNKGIKMGQRRSSFSRVRKGSVVSQIGAVGEDKNQIATIYKEVVQTFDVLFERGKGSDLSKGLHSQASGKAASSKSSSQNKTNLFKNNLFSLEDILKSSDKSPNSSPAHQVIRCFDREARVYLLQLL